MNDYESKREAFTAAVEQLTAARARIQAITQALPDVVEDARRQALREERAKLKTEIESLPDEIGELARLAALADLARIKDEVTATREELAGLKAQQQAHEAQVMDFLKIQTAENREMANSRIDPAKLAEWTAKQAITGSELDAQGRPLTVAIARLDVKIKALESRAMTEYPGANYSNPNTWARPAHLYGERWLEQAKRNN